MSASLLTIFDRWQARETALKHAVKDEASAKVVSHLKAQCNDAETAFRMAATLLRRSIDTQTSAKLDAAIRKLNI